MVVYSSCREDKNALGWLVPVQSMMRLVVGGLFDQNQQGTVRSGYAGCVQEHWLR